MRTKLRGRLAQRTAVALVPFFFFCNTASAISARLHKRGQRERGKENYSVFVKRENETRKLKLFKSVKRKWLEKNLRGSRGQ